MRGVLGPGDGWQFGFTKPFFRTKCNGYFKNTCCDQILNSVFISMTHKILKEIITTNCCLYFRKPRQHYIRRQSSRLRPAKFERKSLKSPHVQTMSTAIKCLRNEEEKTRIRVTLGPLVCVWFRSTDSIPVLVDNMSPCHYHESMPIPWVLVNSKRYLKVQVVPKGPRGT